LGKENESLLKKGTRRIWRSWKWGIIVAVVVGGIVFAIGLSVETQHKRTPLEGEEPITFFQIGDPGVTTGMNSYSVTITNNQPYTILELTLQFTGANLMPPEDYTSDTSYTLDSGGEQTWQVPIQEGAETAEFDLNGDDRLPLSATNINLYVTSPDGGNVWDSTGTDNDELITLTSTDVQNGGYGDYNVTVRHEGGMLPVDFTLSNRVTYGELVTSITTTEEIPTKESRTFGFILNVNTAQMTSLLLSVEAKINIGENFDVKITRSYKVDEWTVKEQYTPTPNEVKGGEPFGPVDTTGIVSIVAYTLAVVTGIIYWARFTFTSAVKPKFIGPSHCFLSLMSLILAIDHTLIALQKPWEWLSAGMIFSYLAITTLAFYTVFSFYDVEGKEHFGEKKWKTR
jgi:hypothetical protein